MPPFNFSLDPPPLTPLPADVIRDDVPITRDEIPEHYRRRYDSLTKDSLTNDSASTESPRLRQRGLNFSDFTQWAPPGRDGSPRHFREKKWRWAPPGVRFTGEKGEFSQAPLVLWAIVTERLLEHWASRARPRSRGLVACLPLLCCDAPAAATAPIGYSLVPPMDVAIAVWLSVAAAS